MQVTWTAGANDSCSQTTFIGEKNGTENIGGNSVVTKAN